MKRKSLLFLTFTIILVLLLLTYSRGLSFEVTASQQTTILTNQDYTMSFGLGELSSAYSEVYQAESVGVSSSQIQIWSSELNRSAFVLQEAALPSNVNNSVSLIQSSVNQSESIYSSAKEATNFYSIVHYAEVVGAYVFILPSSYGLALLTNRVYEWYLAREERTFFRRIIRKSRSVPSKK